MATDPLKVQKTAEKALADMEISEEDDLKEEGEGEII